MANIIGTNGEDTLIGTPQIDRIEGRGGNDDCVGGGGDDFLFGGSGNDFLFGDGFEGDPGGSDTLNGGIGNDNLDGFGGNDILNGGDGNDNVQDTEGNNFLNGEAGDDFLISGDGADNSLNGGAGFDTAEYVFAGAGLTVNLATGTASGGGVNDTLVNIEGVRGSFLNDTLIGDEGNNTFKGLDGDDFLDGGAGFDFADYEFADAGVTVNFATGTASGGEGKDVLVDIEGVIGSLRNDTLIGNTGNNTLAGRDGNDRLSGGDGNDRLSGGDGNDILAGDAGNDILTDGGGRDKFLYDTGAAFRTADVGIDVINRLTPNFDEIGLDKTTLTTISSAPGEGFSIPSEFAVVSTGAATSGADIVYNSANGNLFYNPNGTADGFGTGGQFATLMGAPTISGMDFIIQA